MWFGGLDLVWWIWCSLGIWMCFGGLDVVCDEKTIHASIIAVYVFWIFRRLMFESFECTTSLREKTQVSQFFSWHFLIMRLYLMQSEISNFQDSKFKTNGVATMWQTDPNVYDRSEHTRSVFLPSYPNHSLITNSNTASFCITLPQTSLDRSVQHPQWACFSLSYTVHFDLMLIICSFDFDSC